MLESKKHIIFLGETRFPYGLAAVQRMTLMGKAIKSVGNDVTIICRKGTWRNGQYPNLHWKGSHEGVNYVYPSKNINKTNGFFRRNLMKLKGAYVEFQYLKMLKRQKKLDLALVSNMKAIHLFRYLVFSYLLKIPVVLNLVEMSSAIEGRKKASKKINDFLIERWLIKLFDGALPISDKLMTYHESIAPKKARMKLPILCDYEKFDLPKEIETDYYLYCGNINYRSVVDFVLECYENLDNPSAKLYMIVSGGSKEQTQQLQNEVDSRFVQNSVKLFSDIPYEQLVHLYNHAMALLIPLRPTLQDEARFPHKIGEYLASGNPVITTDIGEIKVYFKDGVSAYVSRRYDHHSFSKKMQEVLDNREKAISVGLKGKEMGMSEFDYKIHGRRLQDFFSSLT